MRAIRVPSRIRRGLLAMSFTAAYLIIALIEWRKIKPRITGGRARRLLPARRHAEIIAG